MELATAYVDIFPVERSPVLYARELKAVNDVLSVTPEDPDVEFTPYHPDPPLGV